MKDQKKDSFLQEAAADALKMVDANIDLFTDRFPHVSTMNQYKGEENLLWTSSFFPGMCYLAYELTNDSAYLRHVPDYLKSFEERLDKRRGISHDLGFLYTLSCVADYKLTGSVHAKNIALKAADMLIERYNEKGKYIQAWGEMGISYPDVKIIIDTMLNLPLLYWTGDEKKTEIARNHAETAARYLIRKDYTSYHTYLMRPETGEAVCGKTHQGYADESTWARGQAWAVYGFALSYAYTKEERFLEVATRAAEVFEKNMPSDSVPYWDFTFTDENPDIRDTSAAAIFCCGLLELCNYVDAEMKIHYEELNRRIMESLFHNYRVKERSEGYGLLTEGVYWRNDGARECVIWGDYFYMEALVRMTKEWNRYW